MYVYIYKPFQFCSQQVCLIQKASLLKGVINLLPGTQELFPFQSNLPLSRFAADKEHQLPLDMHIYKRKSSSFNTELN